MVILKVKMLLHTINLAINPTLQLLKYAVLMVVNLYWVVIHTKYHKS